ncbi:hypothetical protein KO504_00555 [Winogradskyella psychrotolerans]|uniref:hypothetical protein n=1 Tax=Winogradskyella psychrotolerans TaxID=1344585 RepID=UPI001C06BAEB|nr:hypothetical protein [Winogradskyella psychrotolerans]MBU2919817.1 hypothetical protein [Winogradskyella psychrotolerans]
MHYKKIAVEGGQKFSNIEGNQYMSGGDDALKILFRIISDFKIKKVLEVGLGICSILDTILRRSKGNNVSISYFGTEENDFCLKALPQNVVDYNRIALHKTISDIPKPERFNFIIIDGSNDALNNVKELLNSNAIMFIEGGRQSQIDIIKQIYPKALVVEFVSISRPPSYVPFHQKWTGSGSLIFCEPTASQKLYWFKEKVQSYFEQRIRKYFSRYI